MLTRIAAIVQARMGSSRLPGKSLMELAGMPLVGHVIHRLKASRRIAAIVLATSTNPADDALADWAAAAGRIRWNQHPFNAEQKIEQDEVEERHQHRQRPPA